MDEPPTKKRACLEEPLEEEGRGLSVPQEMRDEEKLVRDAMARNDYSFFATSSERIRSNSDLALQAVLGDPSLFEALPNALQCDRTFLGLVLSTTPPFTSPTIRQVLEFEKKSGNELSGVAPLNWDGRSLVSFAREKWRVQLWEKVDIVAKKLPGLPPVQNSVLEFAGMKDRFRASRRMIRLAPLLAALELKGLVTSWTCFVTQPEEVAYVVNGRQLNLDD